MTAVPFLFILTFASPKGGVGKSTSCLAIAGALAAHGYPVHIVDLDQIQTLWAWYKEHQPAIPNLSVEAAPPQPDGISFLRYLKSVCENRRGFVLVDAAGALTDIMVYAAVIAHLTITPAKLSSPDLREALRLHHRLADTAAAAGKPFIHRVLFNEVAALPPSYQKHALAQIERLPLTLSWQCNKDRLLTPTTMPLPTPVSEISRPNWSGPSLLTLHHYIQLQPWRHSRRGRLRPQPEVPYPLSLTHLLDF